MLRLGHDGMDSAIKHRCRFDKFNPALFQFRCKAAYRHVSHLVTLAIDENEVTGDIALPGQARHQGF